MLVNEDIELRRLADSEKKKISADLGDFAKFLAYTNDDGVDDVPQEPPRTGIRKLKGTPVWTLIYPARMGYRAARFVYQNGASGIYRRVENKVKHAMDENPYAKKKRAREFLTKIMPTEEEKQKQKERIFEKDIKISVLVPLYNTPEKFLRDMITSVTGQTYQNWELCLADASDDSHPQVADIVKEYADADSRIVYKKLENNAGIAENTNACIKMASGNYLALFDHDDMLHPCALYECAKVIEKEDAEFVYTDEATFEGDNIENIITLHFKPDFSVDNLRGVNYICHLSVFKKALVDEVGMFRAEYDGSQDHDIIMRLTDAAKKVCHIPSVLYFWRCHQMSTSMNIDAKSYAIEAGRKAVADAEKRRGYPAKVYSAQICKTHYRMKYEIENPLITILIDGTHTKKERAAYTVAAIENRSTYSNYEIRYGKTQAELQEEMQKAKGEYILLFAAGALPVTPTWIEELLMFAQRSDVGMAAMQVLDEKDFILSSDLVHGMSADRLAIEVNRGERYDATGYMGRNYYAHNVSAISGCACLAKKEIFTGLWEDCHTKSVFGKVLELCFKLRKEEKQIVVNPYALCKLAKADFPVNLSASDREILMQNYDRQIQAGDAFYNKNLSFERRWQKK
ncbi:MAG: glycosyltransferase [Lachnospiraceae bacterium]|nr:glycosyltransferase [Lachnospiraceae bacterium]